MGWIASRNRGGAPADGGLRPVTLCEERTVQGYFHGVKEVCKGKQSLGRGLRLKQAQDLHPPLGRQQPKKYMVEQCPTPCRRVGLAG